MNKSLLVLAMLSASAAVQAAPFYLDIGTNYGPAGDQVTPTSTSMKDEFLVKYDSQTTITDLDGNGIDAGDTVSTDAGLLAGVPGAVLTGNQITGFDPNQSLGNESNNGLNINYAISFSAVDLGGSVAGLLGNVPLLSYTSGVVNFLLTFDGVSFINFMDLNVTGGQTDGVGTSLVGTVDFTNVDTVPDFRNLFHSGTFSCLGSSGFYDIATNCGPIEIAFDLHFDTNVFVTDFGVAGVDGNGNTLYTVTSNHDGSGTFSIPEPSTIALLGTALLAAGIRRSRQA